MPILDDGRWDGGWVVPAYDFGEALDMMPVERMERAVEDLRAIHRKKGYDKLAGMPDIPPRGGSEEEIKELEASLEFYLPDEYKEFLRRWRYLEVGSVASIGGLDWNGVHNNGSLWVSDQHPTGGPCLVLGYCNQYADGDQWLVMPNEDRVLLYLHEFDGKIEEFAPSFSLALWRVVHEDVSWGED